MQKQNAAPLLSPAGVGVLAFTVLYMIVGAQRAWAGGNHEFQFYIVMLALCIFAIAQLHRRVRLSPGVLWGLSVWGAAHLAGGMVPIPASWPAEGSPVLYNWWLVDGVLKFDQVVHAYGFGMATWTCWQGLRGAIARRLSIAPAQVAPSAGLLVLCAAAGMGLGALNEVVEFIATLMVKNTNVGGYANTGWDLVANLVGAVVTVLVIAMARSGHNEAPTSSSRA